MAVPTGDVEQLAALAARGDRDALGAGPSPAGAGMALRLPPDPRPDLADEAAQETWVRAVRSLPRFRGDSTVLTWLLAIVRHVVAGLIRARCRKPPETGPRPAWASTGLVEVEAELDRLPPQLAEALVLTQVVGLSYEEAADVMGVPIGTIRSRVFRARAALMESLAEGPRPRVVALRGGLL